MVEVILGHIEAFQRDMTLIMQEDFPVCKKFLEIQATVECRFFLKRIYDMIRT